MGQIKNKKKYPYDKNITGNEYVIGSDGDNNGKTMNYLLSDLAGYFSQYFTSQNQSIKLDGDISGGNGINVISTQANSSLIGDKPDAISFSEGGKILYLENGVLKKIDAQVIIDNSYTPPTYPEIILNGDGLNFIQNLSTNQYGVISSVTLGTIQSATTLQKGAIQIAKPSEYNSNSVSLALPPAAAQLFLQTSAISGTTGFIPKFITSSTLGNSVIRETVSGNVGIGMTPTQKLGVSGYVEATGYKSSSNSLTKILRSDGGESNGLGDVFINGDIEITPLNLITTVGSYQIPDSRNKLIYVTYESGVTTTSIVLPLNPIVGQRIYVMHNNSSAVGTIPVLGPNNSIELDVLSCWIFYYNGERWLAIGKIGLTAL